MSPAELFAYWLPVILDGLRTGLLIFAAVMMLTAMLIDEINERAARDIVQANDRYLFLIVRRDRAA